MESKLSNPKFLLFVVIILCVTFCTNARHKHDFSILAQHWFDGDTTAPEDIIFERKESQPNSMHEKSVRPELRDSTFQWKRRRPMHFMKDVSKENAENFVTPGSELCDNCKRRELCRMNSTTGNMECSRRNRKKFGRTARKTKRKLRFESRLSEDALDHVDKNHRRKKLSFEQSAALFFTAESQTSSAPSTSNPRILNSKSILVESGKKCTSRELEMMGYRLLDWFRLEEDEEEGKGNSSNTEDGVEHHMEKRNSKKKELREEDCRCRTPVFWKFLALDSNDDSSLSPSELFDMESNGYEHCLRPFVEACDLDRDLYLTQHEWCCCFSDVMPPCEAAKAKVLRADATVPLIGSFLPECDADGFFESVQCHASTGQCWCSDSTGHELNGTRSRDRPNCD